MPELPTGTVTFLFTDIEGSTKLLQALGERYGEVLAGHHRVVREAVAAVGGCEVDTQGDAFFVAFPTARAAVTAAIDVQRGLAAHAWPDGHPVRVRMGVHTGEPVVVDGMYVGLDVHLAARICACGHGGQIVVSDRARALLGGGLPGVTLRDLGRHRLKDISGDVALYQIGAEGLDEDFPPLRTLTAPSELPVAPTSFVGRGAELDALCAVLSDRRVRLLTVTGPGGIGKSRTALAAAERVAGAFADGAVFVPLAPVPLAALVPSAVANALGVAESGDRPVAEVVADHLRRRELLLVLDNVEHVPDAAAFVADVLAAAPGVVVLATSRVVLRVYGEHQHELSPLSLPPAGNGDAADLERLAASDAVRLFVERAAAVRPGFALTPDNAAAVAGICRRTDGLPLAVELAASRVRHLSPQEVHQRLDRRLRLLTGGPGDASGRQRTLRDTIDWSYRLLEPEAAALFRQMAVFAGGATLDGAEVVVEPGDTDVLDGVAGLVDASLLRRDEVDGETRFGMLETIREFALERLAEAGEEPALRRRHASWVAALAEEVRAGLDGPAQLSWLRRAAREHENVRAALEWALGAGEAELALRTVAAMGWIWRTQGHVLEAEEWLQRALDAAPPEPSLERAKALYLLSAQADQRGDLGRAAALMEQALVVFRELGDTYRTASTLNGLATIAAHRGDPDAARPLYEEALGVFRDLGDDWGTATVLMGIGELDLDVGDPERAAGALEEALVLHSGTEDQWSIAVTQRYLVDVRLAQGRHGEATDLLGAAVASFSAWGERVHLAECVERYARLAMARGDAVAAARLAGAADAAYDAVGARRVDRDAAAAERHLAPAREALGLAAFTRAHGEGAAMTLEQALDHAAGRPVASPLQPAPA